MSSDNRQSGEKALRRFLRATGAILKYAAEIAAVSVAFVTSVLGMLNIWKTEVLLSVFAALFGFTLLYILTQQHNTKKTQDQIDHSFQEMRMLIDSSEHPALDAVFYSNNEHVERDIIRGARKSLTLLQETGNLIIEKHKADILNFLLGGGKLRIIVCATDQDTTASLAFRNSDLHSHSEFVTRSQNFIHQITSICTKDVKFSETLMDRITVRQTPYPVTITATMCDEPDQLALLLRYADFKAPYDEKIDLSINGFHEPRTFRHYQDQIEKFYLNAYKKLLITAMPREGKTTLIKGLIQHLNDTVGMECVFYAYSEEIAKNGVREGFQLITSEHPEPRRFADRNENAEPFHYDVKTDVIDMLADELLENKAKILIVDEIGLMQFRSAHFREVIAALMSDPTVTLFGTVTKNGKDERDIGRVKHGILTECLEFKRESHDEILTLLEREALASVSLYQIMKTRGVKNA